MRNIALAIVICLCFAWLNAQEVMVKRQRCYLREGPAAYFKILSEIPVNTKVKLLRDGPVWMQVEYRSSDGFMSTAATSASAKQNDIFANLKRPNMAANTQGVTAGVKGFCAKFSQSLKGNVNFAEYALLQNVEPDAYNKFAKESSQGRKMRDFQKSFPLLPRTQSAYYSEGAEGFGLAVAGIIAKQGIYENPGMAKYLNLLGTYIASNADTPEINYRFYILDISQPNAYACPGGYIFVTKGMLQLVSSEAELAFVLGHEIAHISRFHGMKETKLMENQIEAKSAFDELDEETPDAFSSKAMDIDKELEKDMADMLDILVEGRLDKYETEADELGLLFIARSGYNPAAGSDLLQKLINTRYESNNQHYRRDSVKDRYSKILSISKIYKNPRLHYINNLDRFNSFQALLDKY